jgi:large subunit ribosomal protein L21
VEKQSAGEAGSLDFELLAFSDEGKISRPQGQSSVTGEVVEEGREKKILVFHYKRKKQYKKLNGHRQPFTAVRITEISVDGQTHKAEAAPAKKAAAAPKPKKAATKKAAAKRTPKSE